MADQRKKIPTNVIADLLISTRRRCCLCYFIRNDRSEKRVQIAHIDRKRNNDSSDNLVPLCLEHHDEYDSRPSQSKGITKEEVKHYKNELIAIFNGKTKNDSGQITVEEREMQWLGGDFFYRYGVLFERVSKILTIYDPIGIIGNCNDDEYDPEAHAIIANLQDNKECRPTAMICTQIFEQFFSPELAAKFSEFKELAQEVDIAWEHFKIQGYVYYSKNINPPPSLPSSP